MGRATLEKKIIERLGEEKYSNQECLMKIVEYHKAIDMIVEFQDKYRARVHTNYNAFKKGMVENPYHTSVYGVGIRGNKYPTKINGKNIKEYNVWFQMLRRCFNERNNEPTYKVVTCCNEWLLFENFYEWLHKQENFNKWLTGDKWAIDKDILVKGNKVYSPDVCCLVPQNVNCLFTKHDAARGDYPIGVIKSRSGFVARCMNPFTKEFTHLGTFATPEKAFEVYKTYKEKIIRQVAEYEYKIGNITKSCYESMMSYIVEIDD